MRESTVQLLAILFMVILLLAVSVGLGALAGIAWRVARVVAQ